jgi:hypothetical protein
MLEASGQRESATNRLGEHGGKGFGPMRQECKRSPTSRLIKGGFSLVPDACQTKGARIHERFFTCSQVRYH